MPATFTVRAYGLLIRDGAVLVSLELIQGRHVKKFPGGGVEFGEGPADCVIREFYEELGLNVEVTGHFYTTDFFVASAFDPEKQVISIYYLVSAPGQVTPEISDIARSEGVCGLLWLPLDGLSEKDLTLVIDRKVAGMLRERYRGGVLC